MSKWKNKPGKCFVGDDLVIHFLSSGYYDPGCRTLRNGDPGYPPEGDDERVLDYVERDGVRLPADEAQAIFDQHQSEVDEAEMDWDRN